jgi:hypothetical protein
MALTYKQIDGQNIVFSFDGESAVDLFSYNVANGQVTSSYFPVDWRSFIAQNAAKLAALLSPAQRQSRFFLERLIAIGTLDGTPLSTAATISGDVVTLRLTAAELASVIVFIPHSMVGGYSAGQPIELPVSASTDVSISDLGLSPWTGPIDASVVVNRLVAVESGTGKLVLADNRYLTQGPCVGVYQLDSNNQPAVRGFGESPLGGTFAVGVELFVGIEGNGTDVPPAGPAATYSQFIGMSVAPSKVSITLGELIDI